MLPHLAVDYVAPDLTGFNVRPAAGMHAARRVARCGAPAFFGPTKCSQLTPYVAHNTPLVKRPDLTVRADGEPTERS